MKANERRYQVFVSSTYEDLIPERQEVMHALLELDCIPAGMELFPAADEDQWSLIKDVIDDCDYYIVVIGGRYGSTSADGMSYTEREYRYAIEREKPTIAFLHKAPGQLPADKTELDIEKRARLDGFRALAEQKVCKYWTSPVDLGSVVSRSLIKLTKARPAVGWVRGDLVPSGGAAQEMLRLQQRNEDLQRRLDESRTKPPPLAEGLARGGDAFTVDFEYEYVDHDDEEYTGEDGFKSTWDAIFAQVGPLLIDRATDAAIRTALSKWLKEQASPKLWEYNQGMQSLNDLGITDSAFHTIIIQLRALGLIAKQEPRSVRDTQPLWTLTPYGDTVLTSLRAIPRPS